MSKRPPVKSLLALARKTPFRLLPQPSTPCPSSTPLSHPLDPTQKSDSSPLPCAEWLPSCPEACVPAGTQAPGLSVYPKQVYAHISSKRAAVNNIPSHYYSRFHQPVPHRSWMTSSAHLSCDDCHSPACSMLC